MNPGDFQARALWEALQEPWPGWGPFWSPYGPIWAPEGPPAGPGLLEGLPEGPGLKVPWIHVDSGPGGLKRASQTGPSPEGPKWVLTPFWLGFTYIWGPEGLKMGPFGLPGAPRRAQNGPLLDPPDLGGLQVNLMKLRGFGPPGLKRAPKGVPKGLQMGPFWDPLRSGVSRE